MRGEAELTAVAVDGSTTYDRAPALVVEWAPAMPAEAGRASDSALSTAPASSAPALVLLAAAAIFEGYQRLHLISDGLLRPTGLLFAVFVVPAAVALARRGPVGCAVRLRRALVVFAAAVPVLGVAAVVGHSIACSRALGASCLLLAVVALALVRTSERDRYARSSPH